jgi:Lon protease-like protein
MIHYGCYDRQKTLDIKHSRFAVAFDGRERFAVIPDSVCKPKTVRTPYPFCRSQFLSDLSG